MRVVICSKLLRPLLIKYDSQNKAKSTEELVQFPTIPTSSYIHVMYMLHKKWVWEILNNHTRDFAIEAISRRRISEGFYLVNTGNTINFIKVSN
jgi:hypothetical protein